MIDTSIKFQDTIFYCLMVGFLIFLFGVLMSGRRKSKFRLGRAKRVTKLLKQNIGLSAKQQKVITEMLQKLNNEFTKHGDVDYQSMIDTLAKIARHNNEYTNVVTVLINAIKEKHPYCCISKKCEIIYIRIEDELRSGKIDDTCADLRLLYEQHVHTEQSVKGIGLAGFVFTTISLAIPVLEKLFKFLNTLLE